MISDNKYCYALATEMDITYVAFSHPLDQSQNFSLCSMLKAAWREIDKKNRINLVSQVHYNQRDVVKLALQRFKEETGISGEIVPGPVAGTIWYSKPKLN